MVQPAKFVEKSGWGV